MVDKIVYTYKFTNLPNIDELKENLWPRLDSGEIKPIIEAVLPVTEAEKAHELIAGNETFGKVVLEVFGW